MYSCTYTSQNDIAAIKLSLKCSSKHQKNLLQKSQEIFKKILVLHDGCIFYFSYRSAVHESKFMKCPINQSISINFLDPLILGGSRGQQLKLEPPSISILCNKG